MLPSHVDHAVDRAASTEHPAAHDAHLAIVQVRLRLGLVEVGGLLVVHQLGEADGHLDQRVVVFAARLEQQHAVARIRGEAVGETAASGAGTDDDEIES